MNWKRVTIAALIGAAAVLSPLACAGDDNVTNVDERKVTQSNGCLNEAVPVDMHVIVEDHPTKGARVRVGIALGDSTVVNKVLFAGEELMVYWPVCD